MILDRVTLTGADDSIDPDKLEEISQEYPYVEFGILFSKSQEGSPRFPSKKWVEKLIARDKAAQMCLSAHLCGSWVRSLLEEGRWKWIERFSHNTIFFNRIQLNFHADLHKIQSLKFLRALRQEDLVQYIFQLDNVNNDVLSFVRQAKIDAVGLFDTSGGAGILPVSWPEPIKENDLPIYSGYAGGLSVENLKENLEKITDIADKNSQIWIDVETKLRSEDDRQFDLDKVVKFLEIAKPFVDQDAVKYRKKVTGR